MRPPTTCSYNWNFLCFSYLRTLGRKEGRSESVIRDTHTHTCPRIEKSTFSCIYAIAIATSSQFSTCSAMGMLTVHVHNPNISQRFKEYAPWLVITSAQACLRMQQYSIVKRRAEEGCMYSQPFELKSHTIGATSRCPLHK
jgi:hypothetical protein